MNKLHSSAIALCLFSGAALAQSPATTPGVAPSAASAVGTRNSAAPKAEQSAKSKECSMQADKQGLHGKARKAFRNKCKHS